MKNFQNYKIINYILFLLVFFTLAKTIELKNKIVKITNLVKTKYYKAHEMWLL